MTKPHHTPFQRLGFLLTLPWCFSLCLPAFAAENMPAEPPAEPSADLVGLANPPSLGSVPAMPASTSPSQNVTVNLINKLVKKGILDAAEANEMIRQAEAEAESARLAAEAAAPANDDVRVSYVPEVVKAQIRDEIKDEVLAQAKTEKWATPGKVPEWTERVKWFGDVRFRYELNSFPKGNDNTGGFPNFNAINTGAPFDVSGTQFSPQNNVDQQRQRLRLRARMGMDVNMDEGFTAGIRLATGDTSTPVSANQSFGQANQGQGGNFSKYAIWLDRAFIKYEVGSLPNKNLSLTFGRFDNPFMGSEMIWDEDVSMDGIALQAKYEVLSGFTPFLTAGLFPVFNTDFNFSSNQPGKYESTDKYLYGGQVGFDLKFNKDIKAKFAVAYYYFDGVEGRLSDPYLPLTAQDAGNTDNTRPSFAQKGNTYMALRNIIPSALNNFGTSQQYQYFGLATPFHELAYNFKIDFNNFEPCQVSLMGEYVKNLAFKNSGIESKAVNNRGAVATPAATTTTTAADGTTTTTTPTPVGNYEGGDTAWSVSLQLGKTVFEERGDWNITFGYRYIESDAVIDAFTDSDFGNGGTNMKGYIVGGSVALSKSTKVGLKWMGATQIAGPPLKADVFLFDLTSKF
jgi:Putative porin